MLRESPSGRLSALHVRDVEPVEVPVAVSLQPYGESVYPAVRLSVVIFGARDSLNGTKSVSVCVSVPVPLAA